MTEDNHDGPLKHPPCPGHPATATSPESSRTTVRPQAPRCSSVKSRFPSVLAGSDRGTVLMDGHTYHDGSAIFDTSFKDQVRAGMVMRLSCADGHTFSYRVSEIVVDLSPASYPNLVKSRNLYAASGPAQLVMVTCTDYLPAQRVWANRAVVIATPIA